jgi:hypothetical protein
MIGLSIGGVNGERSISCMARIEKSIVADGAARVILEAYSGAQVERRELGTIGTPIDIVADRTILQLLGGTPRFAVKVLAANSAQILASAIGLAPEDDDVGGQKALLPMVLTKMNLPWRVGFPDEGDDTDDGPILYVSDRVPGGTARLQNDDAFLALVLPMAVEQIATEAVVYGRPSEGWQERWYKRILVGLGGEFDNLQPEDDNFDSARSDWAARIAEEFCGRFGLVERWMALLEVDPIE